MSPTPIIRAVALAAASALAAGGVALAPASVAQADESFGRPTVSGVPATIGVPTAATDLGFAVSFTGPPVKVGDNWYVSHDAAYNTAVVTPVATNGATKVVVPDVRDPVVDLAPDVPNTYTMKLTPRLTPGRYTLTVTVARKTYNGTTQTFDMNYLASDPVSFDLVATPAATLPLSVLAHTGKFSKKARWRWTFTGPDYIKGALLKVYYKAKGRKKFVVVASHKLDGLGDATFKGRKGAIRKKGTAYFVIGAVPFSPRTKSALFPIVKQ